MAFNEFNAHVLKICKICSQLHLKNSECFVNGMGKGKLHTRLIQERLRMDPEAKVWTGNWNSILGV